MAAHALTILVNDIVPKVSLSRRAPAEEQEEVLEQVRTAMNAPGMDELPFGMWHDLHNAQTTEEAYRAAIVCLQFACDSIMSLDYPYTHEEWSDRLFADIDEEIGK